MELLTPTRVKALLAAHDRDPKRSLGQNFLVDANTARKIAALAGAGGNDELPVLEIGPGLGSLTLALVAAGARVTAVEIDGGLAEILGEVVAAERCADRVEIVVADALRVDLDVALAGAPEWACVSNLPYNVAVPIVMRVLEDVPRVGRMLVMVQREVGERLAAGVGDEHYGAVSVKVAYRARAAVVGVVPATVFVPQPRVESVLVRIERLGAPPVDVPSAADLFALVNAGFGQRRKMLRRSLRPTLGERTEPVLVAAGVAPTDRAEDLDLEAWAAVARAADGS